MANKGKGFRSLVLGTVIALLALLNVFFSLATNTAIAPLYLLLTLFGLSLAVFGLWQKKAQHRDSE